VLLKKRARRATGRISNPFDFIDFIEENKK